MKRLAGIMAVTATLLALAASNAVAQTPSFAGTWKLNLAKSHLGGTMYTIEKKPSGMYHFSSGGFEADFDLSGKETKMPTGEGVIGKEISATSWELTFNMNGKTTAKQHLSLNGNTITSVSDMIGADGKSTQQKSIATRVSGGPGFVGKWKVGDVAGTAITLTIAMEGANGISLSSPEAQFAVKGNLDGRDYPVMQNGQTTKLTNSFAMVGKTLKVITKMGGKLFTEEVYSLSADGKTLTDESTAVATGEKPRPFSIDAN